VKERERERERKKKHIISMDRNIERNLDTKRHVETHTLRWAW
jgi:hypothetical protein